MTDGPAPPQHPPPDPHAPVDYPAGPELPPAVQGSAYPPPPWYGPPPQAPGYPYAGYDHGGYDPYRPATPPGTNGKATAALVTSLVGLLCCGLPSIVGLILGIVAMRETRSTGQDGYGLALAGVVIGALVTIGYALYFLLVVVLVTGEFSLV